MERTNAIPQRGYCARTGYTFDSSLPLSQLTACYTQTSQNQLMMPSVRSYVLQLWSWCMINLKAASNVSKAETGWRRGEGLCAKTKVTSGRNSCYSVITPWANRSFSFLKMLISRGSTKTMEIRHRYLQKRRCQPACDSV